MFAKIKNSKGSIAITTLVILTLFVGVGLSILSNVNAMTTNGAGNADMDQAKFLSQSAYQEAHYYITRTDSSFTGARPEQIVTVNGKTYGSYDYTISRAGNTYTVVANGYVPNKSDKNKIVQSFTGTFTFTYVGAGLVLLGGSGTELSVSGHANLTVYGGKVQVNSSSASAITQSGSATVKASQFDMVGGYSGILTGQVVTGVQPAPDPLAWMDAPIMGDYTVQNANNPIHNTVTLQPGVYNGGLNLSGNANVTLSPGVYYINGGGITTTGNATLTGNGVTIFITGSTSADAINLGGSGQVTLTPPTSGYYKGVTLFQDRADSQSITLGGTVKYRISGTLYAPASNMSVTGNGSNPNYGSLDIVNSLSIGGNGNVSFNNY